VLDEPTNDLDLETLDLLQEVIADYDGTVLIVSHDRDFLDRTVTVTLGLDGSGRSTSSPAVTRTGRRSARNPPSRSREGPGVGL
jgi:ATPase subunit of ABC transporter with duplicated ATPase domains